MTFKTVFALALGVALATPVQAAVPVAPLDQQNAPIVQVFGGCGPYGHRGPYGGCRAGGQWGGYRMARPCPPGFHLGPQGRRCWPNRY